MLPWWRRRRWLDSRECLGLDVLLDHIHSCNTPLLHFLLRRHVPGFFKPAMPEQFIAAANNGFVHLFDQSLSTLKTVRVPAFGIAVSPCGEMLALGCDDGNLILMDVETDQILRQKTIYDRSIHSLVFTPNGSKLAAAFADNVHVLCATSFEVLHSHPCGCYPEGGLIFSITFSANGILAACGAHGHLRLLHPDTLTRRQNSCYINPGALTCLAFSPDGHQIACGSSYGWTYIVETDSLCKQHDVQTRQLG